MGKRDTDGDGTARSGNQRTDSADGQASNDGRTAPQEQDTAERFFGWAAETSLRLGVALVGVALLLYALGRIVGVELFGIVLELLGSRTGQWAIVALFAVLLIVAASKRWYLASN